LAAEMSLNLSATLMSNGDRIIVAVGMEPKAAPMATSPKPSNGTSIDRSCYIS